jgi:hypothetical protein
MIVFEPAFRRDISSPPLLPLKRRLIGVCQARLERLNRFLAYWLNRTGSCCANATAFFAVAQGALWSQRRTAAEAVDAGGSDILSDRRNTALQLDI